MKNVEINFLDINKDEKYIKIINNVINKCFQKEELNNKNLYVNILLTNSNKIKEFNKEYRNIDKETDVLSFPMFERNEIDKIDNNFEDVLGDIVISVEKVKIQAEEYGHSFERELTYMVVHGFYHLMGYDHIKEEDKVIMRQKEKEILNELKIYK